MIPEGWNIEDLDNSVEIIDAKRIPINSNERKKRTNGKNKNELYPYYGATGQVDYIDNFLLEGEYVLLGEDGAPFLDRFKDKAYLVNGKFWVNNHAHILRSKSSNKYLLYYLNYFDFNQFVSGTTRLKLTQSSLKRIPLIIPSVKEQQKIVEIIEELFSELDKGVESLKKAQQQLKTYRQAVLKAAFEGKSLNGEFEGKTLDPLNEIINKKTYSKIDESFDLPKIPSHWRWVKNDRLLKYVTSGSRDWKKYYSNKGALFIRTQNINTNKLVIDKIAHVELPDNVEGKGASLK